MTNQTLSAEKSTDQPIREVDSSATPCSPVVVSFGGGTNSAAMLIEMARREVIPDLILFADTGGELPATYQFVNDFSEWLGREGMPGIVTVSKDGPTLEEDCHNRQTLPSVAFGFKSCSDHYKLRPQNKYLKTWQPAIDAWSAAKQVVKLIGYDAGEAHRVKDYSDKKYITEYPLVRWGWNRKKCAEVVASAGFSPTKSACYFCPNHKKGEVLRMARENPSKFAKAIEIERGAVAAKTVSGLGRSWKWEDLVNADKMQMKLFDDVPDPMPCGCFD